MLGQRLKQLRGKRTQADIAKKLGISRARYSHYENEFVQPDNELLQRMADLYEVTVDNLLGRETISELIKKSQGAREQATTAFEAFYRLPKEDQDYVTGLIDRIQKKE